MKTIDDYYSFLSNNDGVVSDRSVYRFLFEEHALAKESYYNKKLGHVKKFLNSRVGEDKITLSFKKVKPFTPQDMPAEDMAKVQIYLEAILDGEKSCNQLDEILCMYVG